MKSFLFLLIGVVFGLPTLASCPPSTTVYRCDKMISSEVSGKPDDKVTSASYRIWLEGEGAQKGMRIDGSASWQGLNGNGSLGESDLPQKTEPMGALSSKDLVVKECEWRLSETFAPQVLQTYPHYPKVHDRYKMDLKNSELSVSIPAGTKSFATFKLSCVKDGR